LKKIIDIFIILLSILCFLISYKIISAKLNTAKVLCKNTDEKKFDIKLPVLRSLNTYNSTIIGGIFPKENLPAGDKQIDKKINFYLMGTAIIGDKKSAIFYFKKDRRCYPYKIGDEIDGWRIDDILNGEVVLEANGITNKLTITDERVACSKMRMTRVDVNSNAIILGSSNKISSPGNKKVINKKSPARGKTPISKPKIIRPKTKPFKKRPTKNPFLELLKRIKREKRPTKTPSKTTNPFLELLRRQKNR